MKKVPVVGYEGYYEIYEDGTVYSVDRHVTGKDGVIYPFKRKKLAQTVNKNTGYLVVSLWKHNRNTTCYVHRLVAEAFIPNPENKPQVNHKDSNRTNPKVANLEWVTPSENVLHSYREGSNHTKKKLTNQQLTQALLQFLNGHSMTNIAKKLKVGLSRLTINLKKLAKQLGLQQEFTNELKQQKTLRNIQTNKSKKQNVSCYTIDGVFVTTYTSLTEAAIALGHKSSGTISNALNPNMPQQVAYGYRWQRR